MFESIQTTKNRAEKQAKWNDSMHIWIDSSEPRMKMIRLKILMNRFKCRS